MPTVAIIGGGISGLIALKCCLDDDLTAVCYEMTSDIGGLWNYDANAVDGKASVMKSTVINTSKEFMAFSDFPPPKDYPNYMHNTKLLNYFRMYAEKYKLLDYIRFRRRVTDVEPAENYEQTGQWLIHSENADEQENKDKTCETFDAVMLATGHHAHPRWISYEGFDQFQGEKLHSWQYKTSRDFEDKTVLIIGLGNSAGDMAVELGRVAKQVYLSTRRGTWILNRVGPNGWPVDMVTTNQVLAFLQKNIPSIINWIFEREMNKKLDHEIYCLKPKHRVLEQHPFVNDDLPNRILCGSVIIKPNVKHFTNHSVIFDDGSQIDHIDYVLMATGFNIAFPYLHENILSVKDNKVCLYKYVWPAHLTHSTLAVMGLVQPWGAINPITELQARWAVRVFKGITKLPSHAQMNKDIEQRSDEMARRYVASPRHTVQVDHMEFCDELADEIGCRPNLLHYLWRDYELGWHLIFGPCTPYRYRLCGPNQWDGARQAILTQNERVEYPLRTRREHPEQQVKQSTSTWTPWFSLLCFLIIAIILFQCFI